PLSCPLHTQIYSLGQPILAEINQVMERNIGFEFLNFDMATELTIFSLCYCVIIIGNAFQNSAVMTVGACLYNLEVSSDEARMPFIFIADSPNYPNFVSAATNRLLDVGVGHINSIDVSVAF